MKSLTKYILPLIALFTWGCNTDYSVESEAGYVSVVDLQTESLTNPVGIDTDTPRLSWRLQSDSGNVYQTAYQVLVASSLDKLNEEQADLWNSRKVNSADNIQIKYNGDDLNSKDKCYWKVLVWTNRGKAEWSDLASFSVGLLHYKDWWGRWIGFQTPFPWEKVVTIPTMGARYLRKDFQVNKQIESATAYIAGLGLYEMHLNGQKVGDAVLAPTPTDYQENIKYNVYDVTDYLATGENAVGVALGNGRFFTMRPNYKPYKIKHYGLPRLLFHMEINYTDGTKEVIYSSDKWKGTADGPIRNNNEYDGEYYDARKEFEGWTIAGFDDSKWLDVEYMLEPRGDYEAQMNDNMKVMQEVEPVSIAQLGDKHILDMGQNMVGWLRMKVKGREGDKVTLRFAESVNADGSLFMTNLRDAQVTDTYILKGDEEEIYEPTFTYHGFRYVEISGYPGIPTKDDFIGKMVYDDIETIGTFSSSNPVLNQIYENAWWGIAGNYKGMPVDCPQRNERQPWLGDRAVGSYGESFMFDNIRLYKKWLDDIKYSQKADGCIPDVAPAYWNYYSDNMSWPGTYLMVADMLYQQTSDVEVISEHYNAMKLWLNYMKDRYMNDVLIVTKDSYGDWVVPPPTIEEAEGKNADVKRPSELISSAYYIYFMDVMSGFAKIIGETDDIDQFQSLKSELVKAFNAKFYNDQGYYGKNTMTDQILPLYFGIVNEENESKVFDRLVEIIEKENDGHLSTGLIGTQWLMRTLTKFGRADLALEIATNTTYPSWGYMIENGATTIWELWHGNVANPKMNSQNHTMLLGDLIVWYYESLAGIKAARPGFYEIEMKPEFGINLDSVSASYQSAQGLISSAWKKSGDQVIWNITIPPNSKAMVYFPSTKPESVKESNGLKGFDYLLSEDGRAVFEVLSGEYEFVIREPGS
ncbi:MAG: family 78 glycoside hydrolase catalytic domain [Marinoscillum sp.]